MRPISSSVAKYYGGWSILWVCVAYFGNTFSGHGEYGITAHLVLSFTGLPFALLSWEIHPNGSVLATCAAGFIGLVQWFAVAELYARFNMWHRSKDSVE